MEKSVVIVLLLAFTLALPSCGASSNSNREHQNVNSPINIDDPFNLVDIKEAGLKNVEMTYKNEAVIEQNTIADVYIFSDKRYDGNTPFDSYLGISYDNKMTVVDLDTVGDEICPAYDLSVNICDVDGDGFDEIIIQQCVSISGGYGGYHSRIYKVENGYVKTIFDSSTANRFDTGYRNKIANDLSINIYNVFTGMNEAYSIQAENEDYFNFFYSDNGQIDQREIMIDSFYEFEPFDVDDDGVYEIICKEYVSLIGHSDALGNTKSVLKYNAETDSFYVCKAEFVPNERLSKVE